MAEKCSQCGGWNSNIQPPPSEFQIRYCICRSNQGPVKAEENLYDSKAPLTAHFTCPNCLCHLVAKVEEKA
jgi:hypothetical protein